MGTRGSETSARPRRVVLAIAAVLCTACGLSVVGGIAGDGENGVAVRSPDSGVSCEGSGACGGTEEGVLCDGGRCQVHCDASSDVRFCCTASTCSSNKGSSCDFTSSGCP